MMFPLETYGSSKNNLSNLPWAASSHVGNIDVF